MQLHILELQGGGYGKQRHTNIFEHKILGHFNGLLFPTRN